MIIALATVSSRANDGRRKETTTSGGVLQPLAASPLLSPRYRRATFPASARALSRSLFRRGHFVGSGNKLLNRFRVINNDHSERYYSRRRRPLHATRALSIKTAASSWPTPPIMLIWQQQQQQKPRGEARSHPRETRLCRQLRRLIASATPFVVRSVSHARGASGVGAHACQTQTTAVVRLLARSLAPRPLTPARRPAIK